MMRKVILILIESNAEIFQQERLGVLFLCTGNSCRSQMAEGLLRKLRPDWDVVSAGLEPKGIHPLAIEVMKELGIDISGQSSDPLKPEHFHRADLVITLCGDADQRCPMVPPGTRKRHWPFEDPDQAVGTQEEVLDQFREVRDAIQAALIGLTS